VVGWLGDVELEHVSVNARCAELDYGLFALREVARADDGFTPASFSSSAVWKPIPRFPPVMNAIF